MRQYTEEQTKKIAEIIINQCKAGHGDWSEIVNAVTAAGLAPKNWLRVRSILQGLLNQNKIRRTTSVTDEIYITV